jgi:hypothetical protein
MLRLTVWWRRACTNTRRNEEVSNVTTEREQQAEKPRTMVRARDAKTGRFVPLSYAQEHPDTTVVHTFLIRPKERSGDD